MQSLKEKGFKKKGLKYFKERGELILEIYSTVSRPWISLGSLYEFEIIWELKTTNEQFIQLYMFMEGEKNLTKAPLLCVIIRPKIYTKEVLFLHNDDPQGQDEQLIIGLKEIIETNGLYPKRGGTLIKISID